MVSRNSMLYWYPKLKAAPIPTPETIIVPFRDEHEFVRIMMAGVAEDLLSEVSKAIKVMGTPCFIRTDYFSGKHSWDSTCFLTSKGALESNLNRLIDESICRDLGANAFAVREFLTLETGFPVPMWDNMPVAKERRYFVSEGQVVCHHPYWDREVFEDMVRGCEDVDLFFPRKALKNALLPDNWRETLESLNTETEGEVTLLSSFAELAGAQLEGDWSVDFAHTKARGWFLIDCALAKDSWHPPGREGSGIRCKLKEKGAKTT